MEALTTWLGTYGQVIAFFIQLGYYIVLAAMAIWAVLLFKRLVDYKTSGGWRGQKEKADKGDEKAKETDDTKPAVDEFVD